MRKIKINKLFALLIATASLASCLKKGDMNIDTEDTTANIVTLQFIENGSGSTINSGMQYFNGGALNYPGTHVADTATYNVNLAGATTLSGDLNVTIAVDPTKALDNFSSDSLHYEVLPDSLYHFIETSATIKAGERIAPLHVIFYPSKTDHAKDYILPVVIKDAGGQTISSNFGVIYFHYIGNPMAGNYTVNGYVYHPALPRAMVDRPRVLGAVNATTLLTELGDLGGSGYQVEISVPDPNNTTSIQKVTIAVHAGGIPDPVYVWPDGLPNDNPGYTAAWAGSSSCNNTYDPATKSFHLRYGYLGGNGYRVTEEIIKKN